MPSTVIAQSSYDAKTARLTITFTTGRVYQYYGVPPSVAAGLRFATFKGQFFNTQIRDRYDFREVTALQENRIAR
ncbi:MAG: KTSC domain-containing protein [Pseudolabrys sp.]|nr:KTSC domain-containing protein [Pseudolabrys sp.]MBV9954289.1 KTSC domain-containing protein [Pseudolabrys sp.]